MLYFKNWMVLILTEFLKIVIYLNKLHLNFPENTSKVIQYSEDKIYDNLTQITESRKALYTSNQERSQTITHQTVPVRFLTI